MANKYIFRIKYVKIMNIFKNIYNILNTLIWYFPIFFNKTSFQKQCLSFPKQIHMLQEVHIYVISKKKYEIPAPFRGIPRSWKSGDLYDATTRINSSNCFRIKCFLAKFVTGKTSLIYIYMSYQTLYAEDQKVMCQSHVVPL